MPFITVNSAGPDIPEGVYPVVLADIRGPKTVTAQRGPKAGQDIDLFDWVFHVDSPGQQYDQTEISASTSTASGPRSKMFAFLTAIFGGVTPPIGSSFEKDQLIGRHALATLQKDDDGGWLRITNLSALPQSWNGQGTPPQAAAPQQPVAAAAPAQPVAAARQQVQDGSLPF